MKYIFIVNPKQKKSKKTNIEIKIKEACIDSNLDYEIRHTYRRGAARKIALEYKNEENIIYAVGGDGLISEVLNGIVDTKNSIGIIPRGTGNDFNRVVRETINSSQKIDIGKINDKYFINVACVGLDADSASNLYKFRRLKLPQNWLYTISIIYTFFKYKSPTIKLTTKSMKIKDELSILAICNGRYYGGGFKIFPTSEIDDGVLSICFVGKLSKIKYIIPATKIRSGKHITNKNVKMFETDKITIESENKIRFNVDGEMMSGKRFDIEVLPKKITLYINKDLEKQISK